MANTTESRTPPTGVPTGAVSDAARLAADLAVRAHADFDQFFRPDPVGRPVERVIGVHQ